MRLALVAAALAGLAVGIELGCRWAEYAGASRPSKAWEALRSLPPPDPDDEDVQRRSAFWVNPDTGRVAIWSGADWLTCSIGSIAVDHQVG